MRHAFIKFLIGLLAAWFSLQGYTAVAMPLCVHAGQAAAQVELTHDQNAMHAEHTMHGGHANHDSQTKNDTTPCDNCTFCKLCTVSVIPFSDIIFAVEISASAAPATDIAFHSYSPPHLLPPPLV